MPDPAFDQEKETRVKSVDIVAANETPNFLQSCNICLGPHRTPTLHTACEYDSLAATRAADKGKVAAVVEEDDTTGAVQSNVNDDKKVADEASSSTSTAAENKWLQVASSSSQHDEKCPLPNVLASLSLDSTEKAIVPAADGGNAGNNNIVVAASFESDQPGANFNDPNSKISPDSAVNKGKRKAEETEDGPQAAPAKHKPKLFQDSPDQAGTSSGIPSYTLMQLMELPEEPEILEPEEPEILEPEEPEQAADPMNIQQPEVEDQRPEETVIVRTFQVASFAINFASQAGGIVSFPEEHYVEDHENFGLEGPNRP